MLIQPLCLRSGARCQHCGKHIAGTGLTRASTLTMCSLSLVAAISVLAVALYRRDFQPGSSDVANFTVIGLGLVLWISPIYYAVWFLGEYQPGMSRRDLKRNAVQLSDQTTETTVGRHSFTVRTIVGPSSYYLVVASGENRGTPIRLTTDVFRVGSMPECDLIDEELTEQQCVFLIEEDQIYVQDLDSGQPTRVNGEALVPGSKYEIQVGDSISMGNLTLSLHYHETPLSQHELLEWGVHCLQGDAEELFNEDHDVFKSRKTQASVAAQDMIDRMRTKRGDAPSMNRLSIKREFAVTVVRFVLNEIVEEADIELIRKELRGSIAEPHGRILLDLKNVRRISDAGTFMLLDISRQFQLQGCSVAVCRLKPELFLVLDTLQALRLPYFADKQVALASSQW